MAIQICLTHSDAKLYSKIAKQISGYNSAFLNEVDDFLQHHICGFEMNVLWGLWIQKQKESSEKCCSLKTMCTSIWNGDSSSRSFVLTWACSFYKWSFVELIHLKYKFLLANWNQRVSLCVILWNELLLGKRKHFLNAIWMKNVLQMI